MPLPAGLPFLVLTPASSVLGLVGGPRALRSVWLLFAEAQELEEDLASVEASLGDLVGAEEAEVMAGKT